MMMWICIIFYSLFLVTTKKPTKFIVGFQEGNEITLFSLHHKFGSQTPSKTTKLPSSNSTQEKGRESGDKVWFLEIKGYRGRRGKRNSVSFLSIYYIFWAFCCLVMNVWALKKEQVLCLSLLGGFLWKRLLFYCLWTFFLLGEKSCFLAD